MTRQDPARHTARGVPLGYATSPATGLAIPSAHSRSGGAAGTNKNDILIRGPCLPTCAEHVALQSGGLTGQITAGHVVPVRRPVKGSDDSAASSAEDDADAQRTRRRSAPIHPVHNKPCRVVHSWVEHDCRARSGAAALASGPIYEAGPSSSAGQPLLLGRTV